MTIRKSLLAASAALALVGYLPVAHAGLTGDTVTGVFNFQGAPALNFGSQTVGAGVEFTGTWVDVFNQSWNISVDVFDNGVKLGWTESTRAAEPNGGNISSGPDSFSFDLSLASSTLPTFGSVAFSSSGSHSPGVSSLKTVYFPSPNAIHIGFARMDSTDSYTLTAVPEPETYAMLLVGLGLITSVMRKRKAK